MKRWIFPVLTLAIALTAAIFLQQRVSRQPAESLAPEFSLADLAGRANRLSDYRGKIVFLNLWATWCPPCRQEMPSMEQLHRHFAGRDFVILAVSEDTDAARVRQFVSEMRLTFPVLHDPRGILPEPLGVTGYPETFIIDRDGRIVQRFIGPEEWDTPQSYSYFENLLAAPPSPP